MKPAISLGMKLKRYLAGLIPSRRRAAIDAKARALMAEHGPNAYYVARGHARGSRPHGGRKDRTSTKVAQRIAALSGHEIGVTGSDQYRR